MGQIDPSTLYALAQQWAAQNPAGVPANDQSTMQDYMAQLSDAELAEMLRQDREGHQSLTKAIQRLQQLKAGSPPANYDEAQVLQQGVDRHIQKYQYSVNQAALDIAAREQEMGRRSGGANLTGGLQMPTFPDPQRQSQPQLPPELTRMLGGKKNEPQTE